MALGRYNIDRYNVLPGNALRYTETYDMYSPMTAAFATSSAVSPAYFCSQSLSASMTIGYGYDVTYDMAEEMIATLIAEFFISPPYELDAVMSSTMKAHLNIQPTYIAEQAMTAKATANYIVYVNSEMAASMISGMGYDIAIYQKYELFQALTVRFGLQPITLSVMSFDNIVIPAGGILVIDSENCTAYLDNENVIDLYSGDFLWLTKMLRGLDISSNTSGDIDVKLLYRERFL